MRISLVMTGTPDHPIRNGMDLYRLYMPYSKVDGVTINLKHDLIGAKLDADVYVINRAYPVELFRYIKDQGKKIILDLDDHWDIPTWHRLHPKRLEANIQHAKSLKLDNEAQMLQRQLDEVVSWKHQLNEVVKIVDAVTVSTPMLSAYYVKQFGVLPTIVPNTIAPEITRFTTKKQPSRFTRFGFIAGTFRERDAALMHKGIQRSFKDQELKGKWQLIQTFNAHGSYAEQERNFTNNYTNVSEWYRDYLKKFIEQGNHVANQQWYKRVWAMDAINYGKMYEEVDVALIPMQHGVFNSCKSELKLIEAGFTGCAAIVSDVMPYAPYLEHNVNCIATNEDQGWYRGIRELTLNKELRHKLAWNLQETMFEHFNHNRADAAVHTLLNTL
jgi:hypothetical protein